MRLIKKGGSFVETMGSQSYNMETIARDDVDEVKNSESYNLSRF